MSDAPHTWHRWAEPLAVALNIAYTLGYQAGEAWAFPAGGLGSALFLVICWQRQLKLEAFLWLYYIGMAVYGAWAVQSAWPDPLPTASLEAHALSIGVGLVAWWALGRFFKAKAGGPAWMHSRRSEVWSRPIGCCNSSMPIGCTGLS